MRLCFGDFAFDSLARQLFRGPHLVHLSPKAFQLLQALVEARPNAVSKHDLQALVWPNTFVSDANLAVLIGDIRSALGDDPRKPRLIRTVYGFGYAFSPRQDIESLAILPLANTSANPEIDYLADGISESIINRLSRLSKLRVMARATVFRYKGKEIDPREVAHDLGVGAVLVGRIQQRGHDLIIRTELVDGMTGDQLWGEQYHRRLEDLFAIEEEISREISDKLSVKLSAADRLKLATRYTDDLEAYQLYLRGRYFWNKRPQEGFMRGLDYFQKAIERDPLYALAYSGLADAYAVLGAWESGAMAPREAMPKAKKAAEEALRLDESLAEAHASLGYVKLHYDWDWAGSENGFRRSLELKPNYGDAHHWFSHHWMAMGRKEESLEESHRAIESDPLDPMFNIHLAWHHLLSREYDEAVEQCRTTEEIHSDYIWAPFFMGLAFEQKGNPREAVNQFERAVALLAGNAVMLAGLGHAYALVGRKAEARDVLAKLIELADRRHVSSYEIAVIYVGLGQIDDAFAWLQRAVGDRSSWLAYLKVEPRLDPIRSDLRFDELMAQVGIPA
ncbi:MAG TPA: winged helix-turn-helix domain-containing protein [Thermoanaerobaculia bacterium]|nr:winged helix-turn-helix domain-containing protein [Thermoanaerobaculia bacterium]